MTTNNDNEQKTLEARIHKIERFISERLNQLVDDKITASEDYLIEKFDSEIEDIADDIRADIPDSYDLEISNFENDLNELRDKLEDIEDRLKSLEH